MMIDLDSVGTKGAISVVGVRRISFQCETVSAAASSAVLEIKRAFSANSPSVSFASTQTITLDGSAITEIDVTDTAWLHLVCTTAESGISVEVEYATGGDMVGRSYSVDLDVTQTGNRGEFSPMGAYKTFILTEAHGPANSSAVELQRIVGSSSQSLSFSSTVNLTIDSATITEIDTKNTETIRAVCGTSQASQRLTMWVYERGETFDDTASSGGGGSVEAARYSISSTTGSFTTTFTTLPFDREDVGQSWASNSSGAITLSAGTYIITADVTIDATSGLAIVNNRTEFESLAQENSSGSYADVPGTVRKHYSRNNSQGAQSASTTFVLTFASSNEIRIQSKRASGSSTGEWIADGSSVTIQKV